MAGGDPARGDLGAHEIAVAALGGEIDRRRRPLLAAGELAQVERAAEMALGLADQQDRLAGALEGEAHRAGGVVDQADAADRRRRQDAAAIGLVVERDIAGDDGVVEREAGLAHAFDAAGELAHDLRPLGIAEIHVVGDGERAWRRRR